MDDQDSTPNESNQRARLEERHRLARYLHDSIGQVLCLAKLQLSRIQDALRQPLDAGRQAWLQTTVDSLIPEIDTAVQAIQDKVFDLDFTVLTEVGVRAALEQECVAFSRRTGIPCERHLESLDLEADQRALVLLIVREALCNIARHSGATNGAVTLQKAAGRGILTVRDNGRGMEPSRMTAIRSIGLRGIGDRARALGADLTFDSRPDEGTRITLSFPLHRRPQNTSRPD